MDRKLILVGVGVLIVVMVAAIATALAPAPMTAFSSTSIWIGQICFGHRIGQSLSQMSWNFDVSISRDPSAGTIGPASGCGCVA